jgi:hypothetical protein
MPTELEDGSVLITATEWDGLTAPLLAADPDVDIADMFSHLCRAIRMGSAPAAARRREEETIAAALVRAGLPGGTDVPPSDLPGKISQLGTLLEQARHQARTLAGDVASLTDRLDNDLPTIFDTVWDEMAADVAHSMVGQLAEDGAVTLHEAGIRAFRLALRLVTDHELRPRDAARPRRLDCGCDAMVLSDGFLHPPSDGSVWTCPHGNRWRGERGALRRERDSEFLADHPILRPNAFLIQPTVGGGDYFERDGATRVIHSDGLTDYDRTVRDTSPTSVPSNPAVAGVPDVIDYDADDHATALWGIPLEPDSPHHPAVAYLDDTLSSIGVRFGGCDDSMLCRRKIITRALRENLHGVEMGLTGHMQAVERIALSLYGQALTNPDIAAGRILDATRAALTFSTIFPTSEARDRAREQARAD